MMAGFFKRQRRRVSAASLAALTVLAVVPQAMAQWFPFGASQPGEIVQRLQAEGYLLLGPLVRKETVYLADVRGGPHGRERLVIDAWSGEILQRFVARRGLNGTGFVLEGGDFNEPPPLGPPPARAFREETDLGPDQTPPKARGKSKPSATARRLAEPKPLAQPGEPHNAAGAASGVAGATPTTAAPLSASPATTAPAGSPLEGPPGAANPETPPASGPSPPGKEALPKPYAASAPPAGQTRTNTAAPPPSPTPSAGLSPSGEKPAQKKINDVPVNPLE
jgi:hypothetical protein